MNRFLKRKRFTGVFLAILMFAVIVAGCGGNNNSNNNSSTETPPANQSTETENTNNENTGTGTDAVISGTVTLAGSTSIQPLAEELGNAFMEMTEARIEVSGGGSGAGVKAAQTGTADIGMASRALKDEETGIEPIVIAMDGIAVVVNPENAVKDLTLEQVKDIFAGQITNWSAVGGEEQDIVVVIREEGSGTRDAFAEIVLGDREFLTDAIIQNSTGAVREAVSQDVNAIGFISLGGLNASVSPVNVNGAEPTEENIKNGSYPIARPFNFLVSETEESSEVTQAFIEFILSDAGQAIVSENGYVPIN